MATRIVGQESDQPNPHASAAVLMLKPGAAAPLRTRKAIAGAISRAEEERRQRAQSDFRTLMDAEEIRRDPERHAAARAVALKKLEEFTSTGFATAGAAAHQRAVRGAA